MRTLLIAITCASALTAGSRATAEDAKAPTAASQAEHPCKDDIKKFCAGVQPGEGRIAQCLKPHKDEISQACRDNMSKGKAAKEKVSG